MQNSGKLKSGYLTLFADDDSSALQMLIQLARILSLNEKSYDLKENLKAFTRNLIAANRELTYRAQ